MDDPRRDETPEEQPSYVPASFEKRTLAWMGLAYMLMLLFVITFAIFTGGKGLPGTFPLLVLPAAVGAVVLAVHRYTAGEKKTPGGLTAAIITAALFAAAAVFAVLTGLPPLIYALQNAYS